MYNKNSVHNCVVGKLKKTLSAEASSVAEFLALLLELDASRGWAELGYASLFGFCHLHLNLTRAESYSRTRLARLAGDVPQVISLLKSGDVSLSALRILAAILTPDNFSEVLSAIRGKSTREIEEYRNTFRVCDKPGVRGVVRTIYAPEEAAVPGVAGAPTDWAAAPEGGARVGGAMVAAADAQANLFSEHANSACESVGALGEGDHSLQMQKMVRMSLTLNEDLWKKYQRACHLSNHGVGGGDVAEMMEMLLDNYLKKHDGPPIRGKRQLQKVGILGHGAAEKPEEGNQQVRQEAVLQQSPCEGLQPQEQRAQLGDSRIRQDDKGQGSQRGRYIPIPIRREVRRRDGNRCAYVDELTGRRCECERGLQFDHIKPFAMGGVSNSSQNLRLLCPAHNRLAAERAYGFEFMNRKLFSARRNCGAYCEPEGERISSDELAMSSR
jgi:hypothetical protein